MSGLPLPPAPTHGVGTNQLFSEEAEYKQLAPGWAPGPRVWISRALGAGLGLSQADPFSISASQLLRVVQGEKRRVVQASDPSPRVG